MSRPPRLFARPKAHIIRWWIEVMDRRQANVPDDLSSIGREVVRVWFYLFGRNDRYPDPAGEIDTLAKLGEMGKPVFLKLSARDDAPLKNAAEGESVYLCTREGGRWAIRGEAEVTGPPLRGATPPSMVPLYGAVGDRHWWRRLERIHIYEAPRSAADLGLDEAVLPPVGQAHVIRVAGRPNGNGVGQLEREAPSPLDRLTAAMDTAWDEGQVTAEAIDAAVRKFRAERRYGR